MRSLPWFGNVSYRIKNIFLLGFAIVFLFIGYELAIKKTLVLHNECVNLENQINKALKAPQEIIMLKNKLSRLDKTMGSSMKDSINIQQVLLGILGDYCQENKITLKEFPPGIIYTEKGFSIETNVFVVQGQFIKLLNLIYLLEKNNKTGIIPGVKFELGRDIQNKNNILTATIYSQYLVWPQNIS